MASTIRELGDLVRIRTGKLDANANDPAGEFLFFTCAREPLRISSYSYDCECVLVAGNGDLNVKYYQGKFDAYQRTYIIESADKNVLDVRYLYHFMDLYLEQLRHLSIGGVIKYIKLGNLTEATIPLPSLPEQHRIAAILDQADALRAKRREALAQLDSLTQSIFIEMFGDPIANPRRWRKAPMADVVAGKYGIKAGPFGSSLKKEEYTSNGYRIYGQEQVIAGRFDIGDYYISERKFEQLKSCAVAEGDLLVSLVGSFGKVLIVPSGIEPGIINPRLLKISPNQQFATSQFLASLLQHPSVQAHFGQVAHGGTMGILNAGLLKQLEVILPPIELQKDFAQQLAATEKLGQKNQESAETFNSLFSSLQHRAFRGEL